MKTTAEITETLTRADVEIIRSVYEEDHDGYGDKAGDVYWYVAKEGLGVTDPYGKRWIAQEDALVIAVETLREQGESIPETVERYADEIVALNTK